MSKKHETVNKTQLAEIVAKKTNMSADTCNTLVEETFDTIMELLSDKKAVRIVGFGVFDYVEKKSRQGINPGTKEVIVIPELVSPTFRAGSELKKAVKREGIYANYHANISVENIDSKFENDSTKEIL